MVKNLEEILNNADNLNDILFSILENLKTMDLPKLNFIQEQDSLDRVLDKASKIGNSVLDAKQIKNLNSTMDNLLNDAGDYAMMLSIPVFALAIATGSVGYIFVAPVLAIGGFATKKYANRYCSITKETGGYIKEKTKRAKNNIKQKHKEKKEKKSLENTSINEIVEGKGKITTYQFVSLTIKRITTNINTINDKIAFITNKLKTQEFSCPKEELMTLLQNDVLNVIVKLKIDMYNLSKIKQTTNFYPDKINAILMQCKYAIDAMSKNMQITNEMMQNKVEEIKAQNKDNEFYDEIT